MREIRVPIRIEGGAIKIPRRSMFDAAVKTLPDCLGELIVRKKYNRRSSKTYHDDGSEGLGQNGYYHAVIVPAYQAGVYDEQRRIIDHKAAHEELKWNCNYEEVVNEETGVVARYARSTADMTTVEFEEYLERCRVFVMEWFGVDCPLPGEQAQIIFK